MGMGESAAKVMYSSPLGRGKAVHGLLFLQATFDL
jgi:hypothetical protein